MTSSPVQHVYDDSDLITQEVLKRYEDTPDPRLRELMQSFIRHMHSFVREVKLTPDEWLAAMNLLQETGKWCGPGRNEFIIFQTRWASPCSPSRRTTSAQQAPPSHADWPLHAGECAPV